MDAWLHRAGRTSPVGKVVQFAAAAVKEVEAVIVVAVFYQVCPQIVWSHGVVRKIVGHQRATGGEIDGMLSRVSIVGYRRQFTPGRNADPRAPCLPVSSRQQMGGGAPVAGRVGLAVPVLVTVGRQYEAVFWMAVNGKGDQAHRGFCPMKGACNSVGSCDGSI